MTWDKPKEERRAAFEAWLAAEDDDWMTAPSISPYPLPTNRAEVLAWLDAQPPEPTQFTAPLGDPRVATFNICLDVYGNENRRRTR